MRFHLAYDVFDRMENLSPECVERQPLVSTTFEAAVEEALALFAAMLKYDPGPYGCNVCRDDQHSKGDGNPKHTIYPRRPRVVAFLAEP